MDDDVAQPRDPAMADEEPTDGSFSTQFSAIRLRQVAEKQLNNKKRAILNKSSFGSLMNISPFSVPDDLIDCHKKKTVLFMRDMVQIFFNVPSGSRPVDMLKRNEPCELRDIYLLGARAPMKKSISVLEKARDDDVVTVERTWHQQNMVSLDYLASLKDMDELDEFAWDEHIPKKGFPPLYIIKQRSPMYILVAALREVKKYQQKREAGASAFWIGGCLPMFPIIYMDFREVPQSLSSEHRFNYSLPRACFVCDADFKLVAEIDRNMLTLNKVHFGKRNHRPLSETPYATLEADNQGEGQNQHHRAYAANRVDTPSIEIPDESDIGAEVCGSLDEWLHPLPSSQELEIPLHL